MAPRSLANITLWFGRVAVPVKVFSATQEAEGLSFGLLHKKCGARVKQQYVCPTDGEKVEREDMVKGYEFAKDQYVTISAEESAALEQVNKPEIDLAEFVSTSLVDPLHYGESAYYLGPDKGADLRYRLLAETLRLCGLASVARWATRGKHLLVLVRERDGVLILHTLRRAEELRSAAEAVRVEPLSVSESMLRLALQLAQESALDAFKPELYPDEVRGRVLALIEAKVEDGTAIGTPPPQAGKPTPIIDVMEALLASLAEKHPPTSHPAEAQRKVPRRSRAAR